MPFLPQPRSTVIRLETATEAGAWWSVVAALGAYEGGSSTRGAQ